MKRIPFKAPLAAAIRAGIKTEMRRLINPQPIENFVAIPMPNGEVWKWQRAAKKHLHVETHGDEFKPRFVVGDVVEVCEPWLVNANWDHISGNQLVAKGLFSAKLLADIKEPGELQEWGRLRLARFMPSAFVRTRIKITKVNAERVTDITETQAQAEGVERGVCGHPDCEPGSCAAGRYLGSYALLWDKLHPENPWSSRPWVWRYCFDLV